MAGNVSRKYSVLDLGCGSKRRVENACRVDINRSVGPTVVADLNIIPFPFSDCSFDRILCIHVLEHLDDIPGIMEELYRLCRPGGTVEIVVPHYSHRNAYTDPTHRHWFAARSFDFFLADQGARRFRTIPAVAGFSLVERRLDFGPALINLGRIFYKLLGLDTYESYLAGIFPARDIQVVLRAVKAC